MKYGVLLYKRSINIGDTAQSYAIEKLYKKMGIPQEFIQYIAVEDLADYSGEYIILPLNAYGVENTLNLSPYIIPLFIGYNNTFYLSDRYVELLKRHEPIGCRDEFTLRNMREHGIESYLVGCCTLTLDKRKAVPENGKYYFIDVPASIKKYIPEDILQKSVFMSHLMADRERYDEYEFYDYGINRYKEYRDRASVIVTGRVHCASPCLAMGIPVIIVKQNKDINMSWIDKYIPIFGERDFDKIDWHPASVDVEDIKLRLIALFQQRLKRITEEKELFVSMSEYYENRQKSVYNDRILEKLRKITNNIKEDFSYVIWGAGSGGFLAYQIIKEHCPKASLRYVIDTYKQGNFYDVPIIHPKDIDITGMDYVFVCTYTGRIDAVKTLERKGRIRNLNYAFLLARVAEPDKYYDGYSCEIGRDSLPPSSE